ncbi:MAG: double zinc ribbon domain-containing protein [Prevotella sp.]|nr:double zinc ribbon domain-containing protein [Prevotella sp.]
MGKITAESFKMFALDVLFPSRCPFCGEFIMWNELCCEACGQSLTDANEVICRKCGKDKCRCGKESFAFDAVYGSYFFDEPNVREAVYRFKHEGERNFADVSAVSAAEHMKAEGTPLPDMIVPVPMGRRKRAARGHNQAELFGKSLSGSLGIPVRRDILFKRDTKDEQHLHTEKERKERVGTLFYGGNENLSGKSVLLCDDVMTTGATLSQCAAILKNAGAERVAAVVCAVTRLKGQDQ